MRQVKENWRPYIDTARYSNKRLNYRSLSSSYLGAAKVKTARSSKLEEMKKMEKLKRGEGKSAKWESTLKVFSGTSTDKRENVQA